MAIAGPEAAPEDIRQRIGQLALDTETVSEDDRMVSIDARLPHDEWPERRLLIPAIDAESGELRVFDAESGVRLASAVAASCAVPGVWPPVTIGDRRYIDGGMRSLANADLAAGSDWVLVIAPVVPGAVGFGQFPEAELDAASRRRWSPSSMQTMRPSPRSGRTRSILNPSRVGEAGFAIGREVAATLADRLGLS